MTPADWKLAIGRVPEGDRVNVEERAAIHEFEGKLDRDTAERRALSDYWAGAGLKKPVISPPVGSPREGEREFF